MKPKENYSVSPYVNAPNNPWPNTLQKTYSFSPPDP